MTTVSSWAEARELLSDASDTVLDDGLIEESWRLLLVAMECTLLHYASMQWDMSAFLSMLGPKTGGVA